MLETQMKLCMTELDFPGNFFLPQKLGKWTQNGQKTGFFLIYWKIYSLIFTEYDLWWKFILFVVFLHKSHWKFLFLRYGPKCSQPIRLQDFLIKRISRRNNWNNLIFCMLIQIHINWKLIKKFWGGCGQSVYRILKLTVSQECADGVSRFF